MHSKLKKSLAFLLCFSMIMTTGAASVFGDDAPADEAAASDEASDDAAAEDTSDEEEEDAPTKILSSI